VRACVQADNPTPSAVGLDDDSVIDRMTQELTAATQGLPKGFKLQPVQFEKVRHCMLCKFELSMCCWPVLVLGMLS
jgi:hypothetical protein